MKRYKEIDICRGIGIVLVVLGHALKQVGDLAGLLKVMLDVIYSFHMPLFFILSGFTAVKILGFTRTSEKTAYAKTRVSRLLVPYFVMGLLYVPLKIFLSRYAVKPYSVTEAWKLIIGINPNTAMWFLYYLFICCVVGAFVVNQKNINYFLAGSSVMTVLAYVFGWKFRFTIYFFFFILGIVFRLNFESWKNVIGKKSTGALCLVGFVITNVLLARYGEIFHILTALTGSFFIISISIGIWNMVSNKEELPLWCKLLDEAGAFSMDIYIFSEPIMTVMRLIMWNILHMNATLCIFVCFLGALVIPVPVSKLIVRKVGLFRMLFLGMPYKQNK